MNPISPQALEAMSEEEAQRVFQQMSADLERQLAKAHKQWTYNVKLAEDRLAHATRELDRLGELKEQIEPYRDTAGGRPHYERVRLLFHVYEAMRDMMRIQLEDNRFNLAQLQAGGLTPDSVFRIPDEQVPYLRARARMGLGLALFHWMLNLDGIDMVLRAASGRSVVTFKAKAAEAPYKQRGDALKEAMAGDRPLALFVAKVGSDLADAEALIEWAKATLIRIQQLPEDAKRAALADEEWAKLNGSVSFLSGLAEQARPMRRSRRTSPSPSRARCPSSRPCGTTRRSRHR